MSSAPRPFIHVNVAVRSDGLMGTACGESLSISTRQDWRRVHGLRERYQAVAVGARTWFNDRPRLNVRRNRLGREPRRQPERVIFSGTRLCAVSPESRRTFVIGARAHEAENIVFIPCSERRLQKPLTSLYRHQVRSMLVEGGPTLLKSFLDEGFFDCITAFVHTDYPQTALRALREALPSAPEMKARDFGGGILLSCGSELPESSAYSSGVVA